MKLKVLCLLYNIENILKSKYVGPENNAEIEIIQSLDDGKITFKNCNENLDLLRTYIYKDEENVFYFLYCYIDASPHKTNLDWIFEIVNDFKSELHRGITQRQIIIKYYCDDDI